MQNSHFRFLATYVFCTFFVCKGDRHERVSDQEEKVAFIMIVTALSFTWNNPETKQI